jgi:cytochrome c peroxidase
MSTPRKTLPPLVGVLGIAALLSAFASAPFAAETHDRAPEPISPLPFDVSVDPRKRARTADLGRFKVTGREVDRFEFKVPGLRNVALTAPYLHDGGVQTLARMV